jgi:hypothetical protein
VISADDLRKVLRSIRFAKNAGQAIVLQAAREFCEAAIRAWQRFTGACRPKDARLHSGNKPVALRDLSFHESPLDCNLFVSAKT